MSLHYNTDGFWRSLVRRPAWHLREWWCNPEYRALHRYARRLSGLPRRTSAVLLRHGVDMEICDAPSFLSAWEEIFVNRSYEVAVKPGERPVLVDAGANIGLAALFWKENYGDFRYIGFEPDPAVAACCRRNLAAWGIDGKLEEVALASEEGTRTFEPDGADGGHLSCDGRTRGENISVKVGRLSARLPECVDLLKIDVEGSESEVIADVAPCLDRVRNLFVEWHGNQSTGGLGRVVSTLEAAGFDCHIHVAIWQRRPFMREEKAGMYFQNLNIFAVRP